MSAEVHQLLTLLGVALGSYLIGSINSALIISKVWHLPDPRTQGSGNPGATNMFRVNRNKAVAAATLAGDVGKGALGVWLAQYVAAKYSLPAGSSLGVVAGVMVVVGHVWPVYYRFRGGKGVATLAGMMVVLNPLLLAMGLATWSFGYMLYRRVSVASIVVGATLPLYAFAIHRHWDIVLASILIGGLVVFRHKDNLHRLLHGEENQP